MGAQRGPSKEYLTACRTSVSFKFSFGVHVLEVGHHFRWRRKCGLAQIAHWQIPCRASGPNGKVLRFYGVFRMHLPVDEFFPAGSELYATHNTAVNLPGATFNAVRRFATVAGFVLVLLLLFRRNVRFLPLFLSIQLSLPFLLQLVCILPSYFVLCFRIC